MRHAAIILISVAAAFAAAPVVTKGPALSDLSHSSAHIIWQTDVDSSSIVLWDTVTHAGTCTSTPCSYTNMEANLTAGGGTKTGKAHSAFLNAAPASTLIYYRVCSTNVDGTGCSTETTTTTSSLPSPHPATPTLPTSTVTTTLPTVQNPTTVSSTCSDLISLFTAATTGDWLIIPAANNCNQNAPYVFPASSKVIVIATSAYASLPAPNTRINPVTYAASMPRIHNNTTLWATGTLDSANCHPGAYGWDTGVGAAWKMKQCGDSGSPISLTSVTRLPGYSYFSFGVANSALFTVDMVVHIAGVAATPGANGGGKVLSIPDSTHVYVGMYNTHSDYTYTACTSSCGTIERAVWTTTAKTDVSGFPVGACTDGAWAWDSATSKHYRCTTTTWYETKRWDTANSTTSSPVFDLETNAVSNVTFLGLRIGSNPVPTDPYFGRWGPHGPKRGYTLASPLITIGAASNHIIFDRCDIATIYPLPGPYLVQSRGDYIAFIDSTVSGSPIAVNPEDRGYGGFGPAIDNYAAATFIFSSGGPILLRNNLLEGYGLTVHFDDALAYVGPAPHDITIQRNNFYRNPAYFYGSATSNGYYTPSRQILEYKTGLRSLINGNVFDGNWKNVSSGLAVLIRTLGTGGFSPITTDGSGNVTLLGAGRTFNTIAPGNWLWNNTDDTLYQISTVTDSTHLQAPGLTSSFYVSWADSPYGASDFTFTNNTFVRVPNGIQVISTNDDNPTAFSGIKTKRVKIANNIFYSIRDDLYLDPSPWNSAGGGWFVGLTMASQDVTIEHNTMYTVKGQASCGQGIYIADPYGHEGLLIRNNIIHTNNSEQVIAKCNTTSYGTAALNAAVSSYSVTKNVFAQTTAAPGSYPANNHWGVVANAPWVSPSTLNFTLSSLWRGVDTCVAVPGDCTSDGLDAGVDMPTLSAAQSAPVVAPQGGGAVSGRAVMSGMVVR